MKCEDCGLLDKDGDYDKCPKCGGDSWIKIPKKKEKVAKNGKKNRS